MNRHRSERKTVALLSAMIATGIGLLTIPLFLTPPAFLDLALRDVAFDSDLSTRSVALTDSMSGKTMTAAIHKVGNAFVARIGRIDSGTGTFMARVPGFQPRAARVRAAALQTVRVPVDLQPTFGRLEVSTYNAMRSVDPIAATVKEGARKLTEEPQRVVTVDLPPGRHRLSATAAGFCETQRDVDIRAGRLTKAALPLSPDLTEEEIARFVLGWRNEPRDLDTHFWRADERRFPNPSTVYFRNKNGRLPGGTAFARLDVDEVHPGRYETLTVRDAAQGTFRYFIHVYQGSGTIADAGATVQVYTRGCQVRTFTPPPDCGFRIWNVANVRYDGSRVELLERQLCEPEGTTAVLK